MNEKRSKRARLIAMLLCMLVVIQSFSFMTTLSFPAQAAYDKSNIRNVYFKDNAFYLYCDPVTKEMSNQYCTDTEKTLAQVITDFNESAEGYTFIRIYMFSEYTTGGSENGESVIDGFGKTQIMRGSKYCAKKVDGNWDPESGGHLIKVDANHDGTTPNGSVTFQNIEINGGSNGVGIDDIDAVPTMTATKAAVGVSTGKLIVENGTKIQYNYNISAPKSYKNIAVNGGGVYVDYQSPETAGELVIKAGSQIRGNVACAGKRGFGGGGVFTRGKVTMEGGLITRNRAINVTNINDEYGDLSGGGGVMLYSGEYTTPNVVFTPATFIMNGGTISKNFANFGGGIFSVGEYRESGDVVENNSYVQIGVGARIFQNTATRAGGGVYMGRSSKLIMNGGRIYENVCTLSQGFGDPDKENLEFTGGLFFNGAVMELRGGSIYNNTAVKYADFCYFSSSNPEYTNVKYTMFGQNVGWRGSVTSPMAGYMHVQLDLFDAIETQANIQPETPIKILKIKTSLDTYIGEGTLQDFYTDEDGMLYLWLLNGEAVEFVTVRLSDGTELTLTALNDSRSRAAIHYNVISDHRHIMAKLENPPEGTVTIKYEWKYRMKDASDKYPEIWTDMEDIGDVQWIYIDQTRILYDQIKVVIYAYNSTEQSKTTQIGKWDSRAIELASKEVLDDDSEQEYYLKSDPTKLPDITVTNYARVGTHYETFSTGADNLHNVSINGSFTVHYEFDHFYTENVNLLIYAMNASGSSSSGSGAALPAGTRLLLVDKCCCVEDTEEVYVNETQALSMSQFSHRTASLVYHYVFTGESTDKKFLTFDDFTRVGNSLPGENKEIYCVGYSRYQLIVILPDDWDGYINAGTNQTRVKSAGIDVGFVQEANNNRRIGDSFTKIYFAEPDGVATATVVNTASDANGQANYSDSKGATINVTTSGQEGTTTVIKLDRSFPYTAVVTCDNEYATIIGNYAFFPFLITDKTVTITGLDEQTYNLTVYTSSAEDSFNPMAPRDILASSDTIPICITKDRIVAVPLPPDGVELIDSRFIAQGTVQDFVFDVKTTGWGIETDRKVLVNVYRKTKISDRFYEYELTDYFTTSIDESTSPIRVVVTSKDTAPIGAYRIIFSYGTVAYNYDIIIHK